MSDPFPSHPEAIKLDFFRDRASIKLESEKNCIMPPLRPRQPSSETSKQSIEKPFFISEIVLHLLFYRDLGKNLDLELLWERDRFS